MRILIILMIICQLCYCKSITSHISSLNNNKNNNKVSIVAANQIPFLSNNYYNNQYSSSTSSSSNKNRLFDVDYEKRNLNDFQTIDSRNGFIRKVYSIFTLQIVCTILTTLLIMKNQNVATFLLENLSNVSIISNIGSFVIIAALCFNQDLRYSYPANASLLSINAILQGLVIGLLSTFFWSPDLTLIGTLHTLVAFLSITLFSLQTKYDLTVLSAGLLSLSVIFILGFIFALLFDIPLIANILSGLNGLLMAVYLVLL